MYKLYIDESGKNSLTQILPYAPHFAVAGVIVHENADDFIKRRADQIKFKYWGRTDLSFHATDIRRLKGDFNIFKGKPQVHAEFQQDFKNFLTSASFRLLWVGTNKLQFLQNNPPIQHVVKNGFSKAITRHEQRLTQNTFEELWKIYLCFLMYKKANCGKIIIEAADKNQDVDILLAYNQIMGAGVPTMGLTHNQVRDCLTSISFVTKNNHDTETQLADIGSHFLNLDARIRDNIPYGGISAFDKDIITILKQKTFVAKCNGSSQNSCQILA